MMEATTGFCDSLENYACKFTPRNLNVPYQNFKDTWSGNQTLLFLPLQKQKEGFNCGAISFAILSSQYLNSPKRS